VNFEVFAYQADHQRDIPLNSDIGGHHVALYVDDMGAAVDYLRAHGIETMGEPTASKQAAEGQHWVYFRSPWGMQFELVSYPAGKAYEREAKVKLWHPSHPAE
jgi:glyoxylase I family protein